MELLHYLAEQTWRTNNDERQGHIPCAIAFTEPIRASIWLS